MEVLTDSSGATALMLPIDFNSYYAISVSSASRIWAVSATHYSRGRISIRTTPLDASCVDGSTLQVDYILAGY